MTQPDSTFRCYRSRWSYRLRSPLQRWRERRARSEEAHLRDRHGRDFFISGRCWICRNTTQLHVGYSYAFPVAGVLTPNWREHLTCQECGLNSRMRGSVHLAEGLLATRTEHRVYITEQATPTVAAMRSRCQHLEVSEFVDEQLESGTVTSAGLHHQDLTKLSFENKSFDRVISLEVLEHIPRYQQALSECWRVLAPGGQLLLTAPFLIGRRKNLVRARVTPAGLEHLLPPEYHGDPLRPSGSLAFYHFGWELLSAVRAAGFSRARVVCWHSASYGYLGPYNIAIWAGKSAEDPRQPSALADAR